jgi:dephospho-CoA kinase
MSIDTSSRRPAARDGLLLIGLVGRAGSGKSTVARALAGAGAVVIDADEIGHEVTDQDPEVRAALEAEYGLGVYRADGRLERTRVAARVFADPAARARLDRLVHPRILERIRSRLEALRSAQFRGPVVIDAALMLEWGLERDLDAVIAITAPERLQIERLRRARGWTEDEARARLGAQRSNERFAAAADVTLLNEGAVEALEGAALAALEELKIRTSGGAG